MKWTRAQEPKPASLARPERSDSPTRSSYGGAGARLEAEEEEDEVTEYVAEPRRMPHHQSQASLGNVNFKSAPSKETRTQTHAFPRFTEVPQPSSRLPRFRSRSVIGEPLSRCRSRSSHSLDVVSVRRSPSASASHELCSLRLRSPSTATTVVQSVPSLSIPFR